MPKLLQETARVLESDGSDNGHRLIQLISPGWGTSGYYSPQVLEAAAEGVLFPAGTHMYADHPTATEARERPVRSIKDLISITAEPARVATSADVAAGADAGALIAEARILAPYRELIDDLGADIGVSVRADATDIVRGVAEGREGKIVEGFAHVQSVDWVTKAGRGGRVLQVLESARDLSEARNVGQWVESRIHRDFTMLADDMAAEGRLTRDERIGLSSAIGDALGAFVDSLEKNQPQLYDRDIWADPTDTVAAAIEATGPAAVARRAVARGITEATANDTRDALSTVVRDAYADDKTYAWVRDFDETTVWFDIDGEGDANGVYAQGYTQADSGAVALTGDRTEVQVVTTYVPATRSDDTTTESKEDTMGKIQIEEAEHTGLIEKAGRVDALVQENADQQAKIAKLEEADARRTRADRASTLITEAAGAEVTFTALERTGLIADLPLTESGELDEAAFTTTVNTHVAAKKKAAGAGTVRGMGGSTLQVVEAADDKLAEIDKRLGIQKGA